MLNVYECYITTADGEREYTKVEYVIADDLLQANAYFEKELAEIGEVGGYHEKMSEYKQGWWDSTGETFTYIDRITMCRGIVIDNISKSVKGNMVFMELKPLWRDDNDVPTRESYEAASQG